jgi:hypothetical protein
MTWPAFFLGCFIVGFVLSTLAFALTAIDLTFHVHIPFVHHVHLPSSHHAPVHAGHGTGGVSPFNFATVMAFLAWFGGTGYLLLSRFRWLMVPTLAAAVLAGLTGAVLVFWVMAKVLWSPDEHMMSADYHMIGVLGRISQPIRPGGVGEMIYSLGGTRHSCGARSADGAAIAKGSEVIVTAYDRGIASVRCWDDLAARN